MNKFLMSTGVLLFVLILAVPGAFAQAEPEPEVETTGDDTDVDVGYRGWGPRVGATINPDQFHAGVHLDMGSLANRVRLQPNAEIGFGDDLILLSTNFEVAYRFQEEWSDWSPYFGGGPSFNVYSIDDPGDDGIGDDTEFELGFNLLGGIEKGLRDGDRFFLEGKVGFADSPDFKAQIGWTFFR